MANLNFKLDSNEYLRGYKLRELLNSKKKKEAVAAAHYRIYRQL